MVIYFEMFMQSVHIKVYFHSFVLIFLTFVGNGLITLNEGLVIAIQCVPKTMDFNSTVP